MCRGSAEADFLEQALALRVVIVAARVVTHRGVLAVAADDIGAAQVLHGIFEVGVGIEETGRVAEIGPVREVVKSAHHPYTRGLMGAIPSLEGTGDRLTQIPGSMPRLSAIPKGCAFNPRCPQVFDRCRIERPDPIHVDNSDVACWLAAPQAAEAQR